MQNIFEKLDSTATNSVLTFDLLSWRGPIGTGICFFLLDSFLKSVHIFF